MFDLFLFSWLNFFIWLVLLALGKSHTFRSISRQWRQARRQFLSPQWEFGQLGRRLWPWLDVASQSGCWCISVVVQRHSMRGRSLPWSMIYHDWLLKWLRCQNTKKDFWCTMGFLGIFLSAAKTDFWCLEALTPLCLHLIFLNVWMWCGCVIVITWSITHGCHNLWRNLWLCCKARRNFLLVSHADCVASCLALMPHGRVVEAVDYGATMLAWRTPLPALLTSPRLWWKSLE